MLVTVASTIDHRPSTIASLARSDQRVEKYGTSKKEFKRAAASTSDVCDWFKSTASRYERARIAKVRGEKKGSERDARAEGWLRTNNFNYGVLCVGVYEYTHIAMGKVRDVPILVYARVCVNTCECERQVAATERDENTTTSAELMAKRSEGARRAANSLVYSQSLVNKY